MDEILELGGLVHQGQSGPQVEAQPMDTQRFGNNFYYSARRFAAAALVAPGDYDVFVDPIGRAGQGFVAIDEWVTNLPAGGGEVPAGQAWTIKEVGTVPCTLNDYRDDMNSMALMTLYLEKNTMRRNMGPILFWPGGAGLTSAGVADTTPVTTTIPAMSNGIPAHGARVKLQVPIKLQAKEVFKFGFRVSQRLAFTPFADFILHLLLYGEFIEAVPA